MSAQTTSTDTPDVTINQIISALLVAGLVNLATTCASEEDELVENVLLLTESGLSLKEAIQQLVDASAPRVDLLDLAA